MKLFQSTYVSAGGNGTEPPRRFDAVLFIVSLIITILAMIPAEILYVNLEHFTYGPLMIMAAIGVFYLIHSILLIAFSKIRGMKGPIRREVRTFRNFLLCLVLVRVASFVFEWIYELGRGIKREPATSYIFLIDDSGSMKSSDASFIRYQALKPILENEAPKFPFAIFSFSDDMMKIRDMKEKEDNLPNYQMPEERQMGGTAIKTTLSAVVEDLIAGRIQGGTSPKIILLSDGEPTDMGSISSIDPVLDRCENNGIVVSTIGLGRGIDDRLMRRIAESTGGVYMHADNAMDLRTQMEKAALGVSNRNLLGYRSTRKNGGLYALERILFMGAIGVFIGIAILYIVPIMPQQLTFYGAIAKGAFAGLILELFISVFRSSVSFTNVLYFLLIGVVLAQYYMSAPIGGGNQGPVDYENDMMSDEDYESDGGSRKKKDDGIKSIE